ncbi:Type III restriction enzyme, res subunit family protein [Trichomonas vaginalis G3]|uniref:Type III restriction enzyme, res subunit family protein n=1 Tax=Trichomonas vaginalis (strain ATCC PRA-98 / G3) TaxID=412133 RepID=A2EB56_TRIV3|nr:DNA polymerase theta-related family [Trichomonas vaginalis G3]EAY10102.1 Type III restriction enzyme, res subunit family protein [Trichomonas vaginalis G3]KAI5531523.1 DNA polymerase theta-related family [Trichomonas vaginalis G3]|eukprot:XP_001322325.1 Type III restriction enzyme, res subunit family protein [Trichomonas vaginalis G3]
MSKNGVSEPEIQDLLNPKKGVEITVKKKPRKRSRMTKKKREFLKKLATKIKKPKEYTVDEEMTSLGIPPFLQHAYLNGIPQPSITKLRDWQIELCKDENWRQGKNTVLLVPTSGGKTVAADLAVAQVLQENKNSKVIYTLPFVALANEKYTEYEKRFFEYQVRPFYQNIGGSDFRRGNIAICTYEKAHALLNSAIQGGYSHSIKLIIIDEVHMIGEEGRGSVIEALILKAKLMNDKPRLITLTATINESDCQKLANWIDGNTFIWRTRPTPIKQIIKKQDGSLNLITNEGNLQKILTIKSSNDDKDHLMPLIRTLLSKKPDSSVIVFVNTRNDTINISNLISKYMYNDKINLPKLKQPSEELINRRNKLIKDLAANSGIIDENTANCIKSGVLFHHGGLLMEDRKLIEEAARNKTINVLVATTTLSAGVNIHGVARVIIHNIYRYNQKKKQLMPASQYTQMVGRAGRSGLPGEAFICMKSNNQSEINDILNLSKNKIPDIVPHLLDGESTDKFFLQCLAIKLLRPDNGLRTFVENCFTFASSNKEEMDFLSKFDQNQNENGNSLDENGIILDKNGKISYINEKNDLENQNVLVGNGENDIRNEHSNESFECLNDRFDAENGKNEVENESLEKNGDDSMDNMDFLAMIDNENGNNGINDERDENSHENKENFNVFQNNIENNSSKTEENQAKIESFNGDIEIDSNSKDFNGDRNQNSEILSDINKSDRIDVMNEENDEFRIKNEERMSKIDELCQIIGKRMKEDELIDDDMKVTKFGMAVAGSSLSVEEGKILKKIISKTEENLCISDEIHLLSLCISPLSVSNSVKSLPYDSPILIRIFSQHRHVIKVVTGMNDAQIEHMQDLVKIYGGNGRINPAIDSDLDRIFAAVILKELINEVPMKEISKMFQIDFGSIQKLQMEAATYAGQINRFCEITGSVVLAGALNKFRQRLNFAARTDLLALMSIPSCSRDTARKLVDKGINTPIDLANLSVNQIAGLLVNEGETPDEYLFGISKKLLSDATVFAQSLEKIEELEDKAVLNYQ